MFGVSRQHCHGDEGWNTAIWLYNVNWQCMCILSVPIQAICGWEMSQALRAMFQVYKLN